MNCTKVDPSALTLAALTVGAPCPDDARLMHWLDVAGGSLRVVTELGWDHRVDDRRLVVGSPGGELVAERLREQTLDFETGELLDGVPEGPSPVEEALRSRPSGVISGWSMKSRIRMMYRLTTLDFEALGGVMEMLTLTYPREFPTSGREVKRHLSNFRRAWLDKWGHRCQGVWKLEFQRRGAPHVHLYVSRPAVAWREFADWASETWYGIVGSGDERHLRAGVGVDRQFCSRAKSAQAIAWYFAKHNAKSSVKHYQNEVPPGFGEVGRFWGYWGMRPVLTRVEVSTQQFIEYRRMLVRLRRSKTGSRKAAPSRLIGLWALSSDGWTTASRMLSLDLSPSIDVRTWLSLRRGQPPIPLPA